MQLLTVTPNPSLDLLFDADELVWDDANRVAEPRRRPGGQGINVARAARALRTPDPAAPPAPGPPASESLAADVLAVALLGGPTGNAIAAALRAEGTPLLRVDASAETRTFVAIRERRAGHSLLLNARGPSRTAAEQDAFAAAIDRAVARRTGWVALCGSLPPGFDDRFHADRAQHARASGLRVVVDCDGAPLRAAAPFCDLLVPNQHEAGRLAGRRIETVDDAAAAALELARRFGATVAITLAERGAVMADGAKVLHAVIGPLDGGSAVGAGDTFLAALLLRLDDGSAADEALAFAVAAGGSTLLSSGDTLCSLADTHALLARVRVTQFR